jgi:glycerol kinase
MNIRLAAAMNGVPESTSKPSNDTAEETSLPDGIVETEASHRENWFVGSVDQGTTSSRFLIFNSHGEVCAGHQIEFDNLYPKSG